MIPGAPLRGSLAALLLGTLIAETRVLSPDGIIQSIQYCTSSPRLKISDGQVVDNGAMQVVC